MVSSFFFTPTLINLSPPAPTPFHQPKKSKNSVNQRVHRIIKQILILKPKKKIPYPYLLFYLYFIIQYKFFAIENF